MGGWVGFCHLCRHSNKPILPFPGAQPPNRANQRRIRRDVELLAEIGGSGRLLKPCQINAIMHHPHLFLTGQLAGDGLGIGNHNCCCPAQPPFAPAIQPRVSGSPYCPTSAMRDVSITQALLIWHRIRRMREALDWMRTRLMASFSIGLGQQRVPMIQVLLLLSTFETRTLSR